MKNTIPLSVPNICGNELKYLEEAISTSWVSTGGPHIESFEQLLASYVGVKQAVSCQSGTAGLHLALKALKINNNHEVIVPTLTFIAAVNPIKYVGAEPVFMDVDDSLCIDSDKIINFCEQQCEFDGSKLINKKTNKHVAAILVVHIFGNICDMKRIMEIANKFNLKVIEDATEALGSYYSTGELEGKFAGTIGDIGVYSFNGNKIITTGGGGMIVSNDIELLKYIKYLSTQAKNDELFYIHDEIGYNYRMTNLQAAVGLAQLENLDNFIETKKQNYLTYQNYFLTNKDFSILPFSNEINSNYWFYSIVIENQKYSLKELIEYFAEKGIQTRPIWGLIHLQKPYSNSQAYKIERASEYVSKVLNIPCSSNLTQSEVENVINAFEKIN